MCLISCNNLTLGYENKNVLENISFEVEKGDYLCIVGENGSGKSTLVKGLLGLMTPKKGKIVYGDQLSFKEIGYLPQQTEIQKDFPATVYEVVQSGCLNKLGNHPFFRKKEKTIVLGNIKKLNIEEIKDKSFRDLSGGQQQRVLLARALCASNNLLLLDEPVTGLDPLVTAEFYNLIAKLNKENSTTIIMVSHDINAALEKANKVLHIDKHIKFFGDVKDYLASEAGSNLMGGAVNG